MVKLLKEKVVQPLLVQKDAIQKDTSVRVRIVKPEHKLSKKSMKMAPAKGSSEDIAKNLVTLQTEFKTLKRELGRRDQDGDPGMCQYEVATGRVKKRLSYARFMMVEELKNFEKKVRQEFRARMEAEEKKK